VDSLKSLAFSPTVGGGAAASGSAAANASKGIDMRFKGITSLSVVDWCLILALPFLVRRRRE
jgi:hypothetical protein